jgi:hypothetical protein
MEKGVLVSLFVVMLLVAPMGQHVADRGKGQASDVATIVWSSRQGIDKTSAVAALDGLNGRFTRNIGQVDNREVLFYTQGDTLSVGLTRTGLIITLSAVEIGSSPAGMSVVRLDFDSCNVVEPTGIQPLDQRTNFIIGNDRSQWTRGAESFSRVVYEGLYDGVDLVFRFEGDRLKYDLEAEPSASIDDIVFHYLGADGIELDAATGDLLVETAHGIIKDTAPVAFQEIDGKKVDVQVRFKLTGDGQVSFVLPDGYDHTLPVIIDPGLKHCTLFGGTDYDDIIAIDVDGEGFVYLTGESNSPVFPITPGVYDGKSINTGRRTVGSSAHRS